jgi:ABC-type multidrug transport system fused ATPase/permease subunit
MISTRATLIVSHRLIDLNCCAEVIVLERGSVLERGTYSQLLHADGWFGRAVRSERVAQMMQNLVPDD